MDTSLCLEYKTHYDNGKPWVHYYKNRDGKYHGEYKTWYENGQMKEHTFYDNGKPVGRHQEWFGNGNLFYDIQYNEKGNRDGVMKIWKYGGHSGFSVHRVYEDDVLVRDYINN